MREKFFLLMKPARRRFKHKENISQFQFVVFVLNNKHTFYALSACFESNLEKKGGSYLLFITHYSVFTVSN